MSKGYIGTQTNVMIKLPKREKIKCNCKKCTYFRKNVCYLGKKLYIPKCKWYTVLDDYER